MNENVFEKQAKAMVDAMGWDEQGRPTEFLWRAFRTDLLDVDNLERLQIYAESHLFELLDRPNLTETVIPSEWVEAAELIEREFYIGGSEDIEIKGFERGAGDRIDPLRRESICPFDAEELVGSEMGNWGVSQGYQVDRKTVFVDFGRETHGMISTCEITIPVEARNFRQLVVECEINYEPPVSFILELTRHASGALNRVHGIRAAENALVEWLNGSKEAIRVRRGHEAERFVAFVYREASNRTISSAVAEKLIDGYRAVYDLTATEASTGETYYALVAMSSEESRLTNSLEAVFHVEYNRAQDKRNTLVSELVSRLLVGQSQPSPEWFVRAEAIARLHFLIQHQQWLAREADMLNATCLHGWWPQRKEDFNQGLKQCYSIATDLACALDSDTDEFILGAIPFDVVNIATLRSCRRRNTALDDLRRLCQDVINSVDTVLDLSREYIDGLKFDPRTMHALISTETGMRGIREVLGKSSPALCGILAQVEAELTYQRILRSHWLSGNNPIRNHSPEFYNILTGALLDTDWHLATQNQ